MISNEERREAAENMRYLSDGNRVRYKEEFFELLDETVMEPDTGYHEMNDVFDRLADLIDRPTCRNLGLEEGTNGEGYDFFCSRCGFAADVVDPKYCPECGAEVVE